MNKSQFIARIRFAVIGFVLGTACGYFLGTLPFQDKGNSPDQFSTKFQSSLKKSYREILPPSGTPPFQDLLEQARRAPSNVHHKALLHLAFQKLASENLEQAIAYALGIEESDGRLDYLATIFQEVGRTDLTNALVLINQHAPSDSKNILLAAAFTGLAETDPLRAMLRSEELVEGSDQNWVKRSIVEVWAKKDISEVFDWISTQPANMQLKELHEMVIGEYIRQAPHEAGPLIKEMYSGSSKNHLAGQYAHKLVQEGNIRKALDWANTLGDSEAKERVIEVAVEAWAKEDWRSALRYASNYQGAARVGMLEQIAVKIARQDPAQAAKNLANFPEDAQETAAHQIAYIWAEKNPSAVVDWVGQLSPSHPHYESIIKGAVNSMYRIEPERAFTLTTFLSSESRLAFMKRTGQRWFENDPDAARAAIMSDPRLGKEEKTTLISEVETSAQIVDILLPE